jgi:ABC-type nickel/cobalt efflux system permease component RcnA
MRGWWWRLGALAVLCAVAMLAVPSGDAEAHPLGNVTVNHFDGLRLHPDRIELSAVVDYAEIPTLQLAAGLNGAGSAAEAQRRADFECLELSAAVSATVDGAAVDWGVVGAGLTMPPGEAGLATTRVECELRAAAELDRPATVRVEDSYLADRIGWREITATGVGVRLAESSIPAESVSAQLRAYPVDLLADPLDVRSATLRVEPGGAEPSNGGATAEPPAFAPVEQLLGQLNSWFTSLVGRAELTGWVGLLAVALALVLGASHALLPGHGKTVMAAYLAGRRGTRRDALLVGATVTATHTVGVLVLGVLVNVSAVLASDGVLRALAVLSGLLVAGVGVALLRSAARTHHTVAAEERELALVPAGAFHGHGHRDRDSPRHGDGGGNCDGDEHGDGPNGHGRGHGHGHSHGHGHGHGHEHEPSAPRFGRGTLVGLGVAGGLVPSPTALLVLLGAIGLGRTWFGVVLVLCYGLGMAATLTAAGLLLVGLRDRLERVRVSDGLRQRTAWLMAAAPVLTAALVLVVGVGIAVRGLAGVV